MNGAQLRDDIVAELHAEIEAAGNPPVCLATVLVGDDKPSQIYVRSKQKKAAEAGMQSRHVAVDGNVSQAELEDTVAALVADRGVHGILCQLPLPGDLDAEPLLRMIPAEKDVDGLTEASLGRLVRGQRGHVGCTPLGVMRLLQRYEIPTVGKRAVVVGRSTLVGLPMVLLLGNPSYYRRFGFESTASLGITYAPVGEGSPHFQVRRLSSFDASLRGDFVYCWESQPS